LHKHLVGLGLQPAAWNIYTDKDQTWKETQCIQATELIHEFNTDFLLHCEWDGFPVNLDKWSDEFFEYDYIGAPWPQNMCVHNQVGNGGFSLSSRRFRQALNELKDYYPMYEPSDIWFAQTMYPMLSQMGVKFAPIDVAIKFSFELPIGEYPDWVQKDSFGFHGKFNYFNDNLKIYDKSIV
jgi:hypothetical protein